MENRKLSEFDKGFREADTFFEPFIYYDFERTRYVV